MTAQNLHNCQAYLFWEKRQTVMVELGSGQRGVLMMRGEPLTLAPIEEPGTYEVDAQMAPFSTGSWPMAMVVVELAQVPAWLALPVKQIDAILDRFVELSGQRPEGTTLQ